MPVEQFTSSHSDRSNHTGYQFEFYCDRCRQAFMSSFQTSKAGVAGGLLRAAGGLLGGKFHQLANASDHLKDALRGPAWDSAFSAAVAEGKKTFKHCPRCSMWVCPERCWNAPKGMCNECATAQPAAATATCPSCGAASSGAKFCAQCGKPMQPAKVACANCGATLDASAKFCGECGEKRG